jgi:general secretion pathway protein D
VLKSIALRLRGAVFVPAIALSGCQGLEVETGAAPTADAWNSVSRAHLDGGGGYGYRSGGVPLPGAKSAAEPTIIDGTGRFLGGKPSSTEAQASETGNSVTLNLVGVPIPQAAKTVLGDLLAVKYTLDPGLEGKITLQTPGSVSRKEAIDLFQAALRSSNATMVYAGGAYKIVPIDQATAGAQIRVEGDSEASEKFGSAVHVVQLKYVSAGEIRRIIDLIAPRGGVVRTDDVRNTITLSGNDQDTKNMLEAISVFDVDVMKGMSFGIVPVRTSQPSAIADELKTIFASQKEGPMAGMVQFLPNKRLGAILVITPQKSYLTRAVTWIKKLDAQAEGSEKEFYTYPVQNRSAKELVAVLQSMFSNGKETGGTAAQRNVAPQYSETNLQSPAVQPPQSQPSSGLGGMGLQPGSPPTQPRPQSMPSAGADVTSLVPLGQDETGEPRIKVVADENKNAVLIEATPADYRRVMRVIGALDVVPNQVLIEATIAEVTLNDDLKFGLRWYLQNKSSAATFTDDVGGAVGSIFPGFSYALTAANVTATLTGKY